LQFVSPALKNVIFPVLSRMGYFRHRAGAGPADAAPAIVTYHGVFPRDYEIKNRALDGNLVYGLSLRRQLQLLTNDYHVIAPSDFLRWLEAKISLPPRSVLLTCDDALQNTLTEMLPILQEFKVSCLFFATGASAGEGSSMLWYEELYRMLLQAPRPIRLVIPDCQLELGPVAHEQLHGCWWNLVERFSQFERAARRSLLDEVRSQVGLTPDWAERIDRNAATSSRFLMLNRKGLRQLAAAGMEIGAHSMSHPILSRAGEDIAWQEISESKLVLEEALGKSVWAFGYPFGNAATVSPRDVGLAERAGFRCAFLNVGGGFGAKVRVSHNSRFAFPRVHVTADMTVPEFEAHLSGFYRWIRERTTGVDETAFLKT